MFMKTMIIGDVHLTHRNLPRSQLLLDRLAEQAESWNPDAIILLGDVFDEHRHVMSDCLTIYTEFLKRLSKFWIIHIVGNHEMPDSRTFLPKIHAVQPFKLAPNLTIIDTPTSIQASDGTFVGLVPYVPLGRFQEAVQMLEQPPKVVFGHQEFKNCAMREGFLSENGDEVPEGYQVISGHIHGKQRVGNVWYPGTPCQQNFSESEDKYVYLIEIANNGYKVLSQSDLDLPKMKTIECSVDAIPELPSTDALYRYVISGTPGKITAYKKTETYRTLARSVKIKFNVIVETAKRTENERNLSFDERFAELVNENGLKEIYEAVFR
jgi:DNA repair exonuclease SbcCD nuclease subunit